jgi:hypothetical protein
MDTLLRRPNSAQSTGLRRLWKQRTAKNFAEFCRVFSSPDVAFAARALAKLNGNHRQAVMILSRAFDPLGRPTVVNVSQRRPEMAWSVLQCSEETPFRATTERELTRDEMQSGASMFYVMTMPKPYVLVRGLHGIVYTDHSLLRHFDRDPRGDLDGSIYEAHARLMAAPTRNAPALIANVDLMVPAGNGAFWCSFSWEKSVDTGGMVMVCRCRTWVHREQISEAQWALSRELLESRDGDVPLSETILSPMSLRRKPDIPKLAAD